jgi:putative flippase GtrA
MNHIAAEIIAAIVALHLTFLLHDRWTYQLHTPIGTERLPRSARYISYLFTNSLGSLVTVIAFGFLYSYLTRFTSLLTAALAGLVWNYLVNTYVIWAKKKTLNIDTD